MVIFIVLRDHNPDLLDFNYSLDTVKDLQKDLVFDKYEAAQKYAKVTFDIQTMKFIVNN